MPILSAIAPLGLLPSLNQLMSKLPPQPEGVAGGAAVKQDSVIRDYFIAPSDEISIINGCETFDDVMFSYFSYALMYFLSVSIYLF